MRAIHRAAPALVLSWVGLRYFQRWFGLDLCLREEIDK